MTGPLKPLKWYRKLATAKGRREAGAFIVEGHKAIKQIIAGHPDEIMELLTVEEAPHDYRRFPVRRITESQCRYICSTQTPQGIAAVVRIPEDVYCDRLPEDPGGQILLLDGIQDPGNAGTLIRTAAAFGFSGAVMSDKCADPLSPKCVQAAAGATLSIWMRKTESYVKLIKQLQGSGFAILATDVNGNEKPATVTRERRFVLALGSEAAGLSEEITDIADYRLYVPIRRDSVESLNVAVCGAILMYLSTQAG